MGLLTHVAPTQAEQLSASEHESTITQQHQDSLSGPSSQPESIPGVDRPAIAGRRVVKHFDFNERPLGNYESTPMQWRAHTGVGFPNYLEGKFDSSLGHENAPSFRLDIDGGSIGYRYDGRDISVRTNSDYFVVVWVKTSAIMAARAYITACYLDRKGGEIAGTERRSKLAGGEGDTDEWQPLTLGLPGNVSGSRYIGVSLWLTQTNIWKSASPLPHTIQKEDVRGTAWFDDLTVYRLPRVALSSSRAGNIFRDDETPELRAEVTDPDGLNLTATLILRDADGQKIDERLVSIHSDRASGFERFLYPELPVGAYEAELLIATGTTSLVCRELQFVKLAPTVNPPATVGRRFGIVLRNAQTEVFDAQRELLAALHPEFVKVPVWSLRTARLEVPGLDAYLQAVVDAGAEPIGVLVDESVASTFTPAATSQPVVPRGLMELLAGDSAEWRPLLGGTWARYAGLISMWQLGQDGNDTIASDARLAVVIPALRREMTPLMSRPVLATTASAHQPMPASQPADYHCVTISAHVSPGDFKRQLAPLASAYPGKAWALVEPPAKEGYDRRWRLFDQARRLVEALFITGNGVFVDAPWEIHPDAMSPRVSPTEDYIVFHTVSDLLGDATPVSRTQFDGQVRALVFDRNGRSTLFAWDSDAPPQGREHYLPIGADTQIVDIWGHRHPIESVGQLQRVVIGPEPVFIVNATTWMVEFLRQFQMDPPSVEFSYDAHERQIMFRNTYREPITGLLRLIGPPDWDIRPSKIAFALAAGQVLRQSVSLRFPINAEAGLLPIVGEFTLDADRRYEFTASTWFDLMLKDIDMETYTYRMDGRLIVRQTMTNHSASPVHFQGYLLAPGRPRIERTFANFEPGQTVTKDFIVEHAADLSGRNIRIGLKEIQGDRAWNRIIAVP